MASLAELTEEQFSSTRELIYEATGIRIQDGKRTLLSNRLRRRMNALGYEDFSGYLEFLKSSRGRGEVPQFIDVVTTHETFFFRNSEQFDWFRTQFVSEAGTAAFRGERGKSLRIWSAACSTGEEPYSIAICLLENRLKLNDWSLDVLATDISGDVGQQAAEGCYRERALELVTPEQRRRYFERKNEDGRTRVNSAVRDLVRFEQHNLLHPLREDPFDCIFLKNVMIYFDEDSKRRVIANVVRQLAPGGYIVIGMSEGVFNMLDPLVKRLPWLYQKAV